MINFILEHLHKTSMKYHIVINQLACGNQVTRSVKMKYILNSLRIKNSSLKLRAGTITISEFLLQCSHSTNGYLTRELNWTGNDNLPISMCLPIKILFHYLFELINNLL